ncbi:MAG: hypothetical protein M1821_002555 [Bathelium mastoideum]|nr:MAG: hypothetical protein M1821_002555 [Bathelium mastoideum]
MPLPFTELPAELRLEVYGNLFPKRRYIVHDDLSPSGKVAFTPLAYTCRQMRNEIFLFLVKNKLLVFRFCSQPTASKWGRTLDCNTRLFACKQEIYDTTALPKADREAFVECEWNTFFEADALSFAKFAPAAQKLWFIIQGKGPWGFSVEDRVVDKEKRALGEHCYRQLVRNNGGWLFDMAKECHTFSWGFLRVGREDGWQVVGRYEEDDEKRMMWVQDTDDKLRCMLVGM